MLRKLQKFHFWVNYSFKLMKYSSLLSLMQFRYSECFINEVVSVLCVFVMYSGHLKVYDIRYGKTGSTFNIRTYSDT